MDPLIPKPIQWIATIFVTVLIIGLLLSGHTPKDKPEARQISQEITSKLDLTRDARQQTAAELSFLRHSLQDNPLTADAARDGSTALPHFPTNNFTAEDLFAPHYPRSRWYLDFQDHHTDHFSYTSTDGTFRIEVDRRPRLEDILLYTLPDSLD